MMQRVSLAAAALTALMLFTACGEEPEDSVASADGSASGEETPSEEADRGEGLQNFAECMREQGVDFPDPDPEGGFEGAEELRDTMEAEPEAVEACQEHLASGEQDFSDPAVQEAMLEFAQCMRDNGVEDMPDPGDEGFGPTLLEEGDDDPDWDAAIEACQGLLGEVRDQ